QMGEGDHLVIVDNGSDDDSLIVLREGLDELRGAADPARVSLVNAGTNDGFGAGVMAGAAGLREDAVVLLNNDATVRDGFLDALLAPLGEAVGATTALILLTGTWRPSTPSDTEFLVAPDGDSGGQVLINSTGNEVDHAGNGYDRSWLDPANSPLPAPEVFGLCGGACAIDSDAWRAVGGVRTDLFMYYEDTDLSYKLREAGYEVRFVAGAVVDHEHAASSGTSSPMFLRVNARNRIIVAAQHAPWGVVARAIARSIARALRSGGRGPVARGVLQGLLALPRALRHRTASRS
ncbi:MAG: glycosyltransferase family 2 protein, partial [Thermobifida sp.]|nr:glycosyltransferase family 2 protein [Thermobifida sp.]